MLRTNFKHRQSAKELRFNVVKKQNYLHSTK